jgi:outer membrane protein OmpA-like peptidoglycan-associated protein
MANGQWGINFQTGSNAINGSTKDLETIYNLLVQAEQAKLKVIGHTDNTGNSNNNITLSVVLIQLLLILTNRVFQLTVFN